MKGRTPRRCDKFHRLSEESRDRGLSFLEQAFVSKHRVSCADCAQYENDMAFMLGALRANPFSFEPKANFVERVARRFEVGKSRETIRYWMPAVAGGLAASIAMLAALQAISTTGAIPGFKPKIEQSRVLRTHEPYPLLLLDRNGSTALGDRKLTGSRLR